MPTDNNKEHILTSLAKLQQYFNEVALQVARKERSEFERKLLNDLSSSGHTKFATELREVFNADK